MTLKQHYIDNISIMFGLLTSSLTILILIFYIVVLFI